MGDHSQGDALAAIALIIIVSALVFVRGCLGTAQRDLPATPPESLYQPPH